MSEASVSTTSSRIKQFGLYRTIDARTEEFLRLSRKRQLRQGCACAAVSTAITVTIVVSVILIYEYGIISEFSSKSSMRPNWLGLMNTSEAVPFEAKFNKASINLESSIPLLPLVLKALKKNRYYDNIIEDASSPNPLYEKKDADDLLTKNFFSDTRNWMRIPPSRIYAIEYKTSPIVYYKNPTRNTDYFTKIRRIRDYQRIMNYVDKMISERITGSTMPMLKNSYTFDKILPIPYTTPMSTINYKTKHNLQSDPKEVNGHKKPKCSCPKKMNDLLNKMITILQKLLPNVTQDILTMPKPCDHSHKQITNNVTESSPTTVRPIQPMQTGIISKTVENSKVIPESNNNLEEILPAITKVKQKQSVSLFKSLPPKVDYTLQTIIKLIRPKTFRGNAMINDLKLHKSKTMKPSPESTEDYYLSPEDKTKHLTILETSSNVTPEPVTANLTSIIVNDNVLNIKDVTSNTITTVPTFYDETDDDYVVVTTTAPNINSFDSLDVHSLELVKSKMIPNKIELNTKGESLGINEKSKLLYDVNSNMFNNNSLIWGLLRKMGQLIKSKSIITETNTEEPIDYITYQDGKMNTLYNKGDYFHSVDSIPPYSQAIQNFTATPLYTTKKSKVNKNEQDLTYKLEDVTLEDEEEKTSYEEALTSNNLKKIEKIINLLNTSETEQHNTNITPTSYQWENVNIEEDKSVEDITKYNISKSRSSYLEIQRNDWKHDDHQEYDNIVVLLIYEYMITVETNLVQKKRSFNSNHTQNDFPVADRLDRSRFGFDQDYYEKMPLLVNSLQEVNYVDPSLDISISSLKANKKSKSMYIRPKTVANVHKFIRRTSPRPFVFEYRSPHPKPFSKFNGIPKNWVERYRNAERLKNLHELIKYLEKTLHAKFGDMYLPNKSQVAFSGFLMSPMNTEDVASYTTQNEETPQGSRKVEVKTNHQSDRLYTYRPDNPGDVNLLADGFRFSPTIFSTTNRKKSKYNIPMPRSLPEISKKCLDNKCDKNNVSNIDKKLYLPNSVLIKSTTLTQHSKPKSLNVMLNFMPLQETASNKNDNKNEEEKIYITTSKPLFQYKRKMTYPVRRTYLRNDRLKFVVGKRKNDYNTVTKKYESPRKILFNFNVYTTTNSEETDVTKMTEGSNLDIVSTSTASTSTKLDEEIKYATDDYLMPNFSSVEDYHIGSSGIIPIELRPTPVTYPVVTPIVPLTSAITTTETVYTNPPEIFKFSPEDAKIPDQYISIDKSKRYKLEDVQNGSNYDEFSKNENPEVLRETLLIKLRNMAETTTEEDSSEDDIFNVETTTDVEMGIATETYVPQINGHYRNMKHKTLTSILQENSERYRKKRLENLMTTQKSTYVPMYDIRRNRNNTSDV